MLSDIHWYACRAKTLKDVCAVSGIVSLTESDKEIVLRIVVLMLFVCVCVCVCLLNWLCWCWQLHCFFFFVVKILFS